VTVAVAVVDDAAAAVDGAGGAFRPQTAPKTTTNRLLEPVFVLDVVAVAVAVAVDVAGGVAVAVAVAVAIVRAQYRSGDRNESSLVSTILCSWSKRPSTGARRSWVRTAGPGAP